MSEQDIIAELPSADFCPEEEAPTNTPTDVKTDTDELKEIFQNCTSKQEALDLMHKNKIDIDGGKKFRAENGKTYSLSNVRKAINKLENQGKFTNSQTKKLREATYKIEAPETHYTPEPEPVLDTPDSFTEQVYASTPAQPPYTLEATQPLQPKEYVEPPSCMVRSCTGIAKSGFKCVPHVLASDKESLEELKEIWDIPKEDLDELGFEFANLLKSLGISPEIASGGNALAKVIGPIGASWKHIEKKFLNGGKQ